VRSEWTLQSVGLGALLAMVMFALFVWPSRYRYDHSSAYDGSPILVRIDRLTGSAEYFCPSHGWVNPEVEEHHEVY
jgi:hypothetical protein